MFFIGTDIVAVERLKRFESFSYDQMRRIFSREELEYCKLGDSYDWPSLAARFAAKEAFFKAISAALVSLGKTKHEFSFLFLCQHVSVSKTTWDVPVLVVGWEAIEEKVGEKIPDFSVQVSMSHEREYVVAMMLLLV
ncbi:4'-phosphopantetheinyl transferase superfamily protein [Candidatus Babeliales bacterium]|nr:4'-phosphopantetheinyl transferase superfamily protein [Candidatus Babeliales bacterium]